MTLTNDQASVTEPQRNTGRRPGRPSINISPKQKKEKSRQSARECRTRKNIRYQYLEQLVRMKENAVFKLRKELERHRQWCKHLDQGIITKDLMLMFKVIKPQYGQESCRTSMPPNSTIQNRCSPSAGNEQNGEKTEIPGTNSLSKPKMSKLYSILTGKYDCLPVASDIKTYEASSFENLKENVTSSFTHDAESLNAQHGKILSESDDGKTSGLPVDIIDWICRNEDICKEVPTDKYSLAQDTQNTEIERIIEMISEHPDFLRNLTDENALTDLLSGTVETPGSFETIQDPAISPVRHNYISTKHDNPSQTDFQTGLDIQNVSIGSQTPDSMSSSNVPVPTFSTQKDMSMLPTSEQLLIPQDIFNTSFSQQSENHFNQDASTLGIRGRAGSTGSIDFRRSGFHNSNNDTSRQHMYDVCCIGDTKLDGQNNEPVARELEGHFLDYNNMNTPVILSSGNSWDSDDAALATSQRPLRPLSFSEALKRQRLQHARSILNADLCGIQIRRSKSENNSSRNEKEAKYPFLFSLLKTDISNQ